MQPTDDSPQEASEPDASTEAEQLRSRIRLAREEDVQTQRSIVRFIVAVTIGFILSTAVMALGMALGQMWLFYTGMGMAFVCMATILFRL